ncbi:YceI family protein [uncultured Acetobacteroides sp.]|uniref:YceI family protein n=1 Tax=uncultured Acetobacteroides sp. TaxID=1760811 RepID=UPI0029F55015|nr:YceI family protein [uncultured Acetobacteroides sp.]
MLQIFLLQAVFLALGASNNPDVHTYAYEILSGSQISISGKSNINTFRCYTANIPRKGSFLAFEPEGVNVVDFYHADVDLLVKSLSCGSKLIEKDLNRSLMADRYPFIMLSFKDAKLVARYPNRTAKYQTTLSMTIASTTRNVGVDILLQQVDHNTFRIVGSQVISMTDFNIKQPTAMFGMIVVDREITISFNILAAVYKDVLGSYTIPIAGSSNSSAQRKLD